MGSSNESVDSDSVDEHAERLNRQIRWIEAKVTLEPGKWDGICVIDRGTGTLTPASDSWTPAMRQEFGRFKGGLMASKNGGRPGRPRKYDDEDDSKLIEATLELRKARPGCGAPFVTAQLVKSGFAVKQWKISELLKTLPRS
jgi:hypothetical protein